MKNDEFNDIFAELKAEYLHSITEKLSTIEGLWQQHDRETLENEYHKIKGTGTTYGVPEATKVAEIMEHLCKSNHTQLGTAILISTDLFRKIKQYYLEGITWNLEHDENFSTLSQMFQAQKSA